MDSGCHLGSLRRVIQRLCFGRHDLGSATGSLVANSAQTVHRHAPVAATEIRSNLISDEVIESPEFGPLTHALRVRGVDHSEIACENNYRHVCACLY